MKYWEEKSTMNSLRATAIGLFIFFSAMFWIQFTIEKQILEKTNMTIDKVWKLAEVPADNSGDIFISIIITMFIFSTIMYLFGKFKLNQNKILDQ